MHRTSALRDPARELILQHGDPTVAFLQRHLRLGYAEALTLQASLEGDVLTPPQRGGNRLLMAAEDDWRSVFVHVEWNNMIALSWSGDVAEIEAKLAAIESHFLQSPSLMSSLVAGTAWFEADQFERASPYMRWSEVELRRRYQLATGHYQDAIGSFLGGVLSALGQCAWQRKELQIASERLGEALELGIQHGFLEAENPLRALDLLCYCSLEDVDFPTRRWHEQAIVWDQGRADRWAVTAAKAWLGLARVAASQGETALARQIYAETISRCQHGGDDRQLGAEELQELLATASKELLQVCHSI